MKEYKIQARCPTKSNGNWIGARRAGGVSCPVYTDRKSAEHCVEQMREAWPLYVEKWNKGVPANLQIEAPIDFRILSREVTEWEPESN